MWWSSHTTPRDATTACRADLLGNRAMCGRVATLIPVSRRLHPATASAMATRSASAGPDASTQVSVLATGLHPSTNFRIRGPRRPLSIGRGSHLGDRDEKEKKRMFQSGRKHLKYLISSFAAVVFAYNC